MADSTWRPGDPAAIDGDRVWNDLDEICRRFGPRPAGSDSSRKQREWVSARFQACGGQVREQPFQVRHPLTKETLSCANLVGSWFPDRSRRLLVAAHSDPRPQCDEERDPQARRTPYLGANDGASGVALLMEIARHLTMAPTDYGVDLVLFDAEELVYVRVGDYFLGSREFVRLALESEPDVIYEAGLLADMVGGGNMIIDREMHSQLYAPELVAEVWAIARRLKISSFRDRVGRAVYDDHIPFLYHGIPMIDLIGFNDPHWHKMSDRPEFCSPQSSREVGQVITAWIATKMVEQEAQDEEG